MKVLVATIGSFVFGTAALAAVLVSEEANSELPMEGLALRAA